MTLITDLARAAAATPIVVVHIGNFDAFLAHTDARTRGWLAATGFRAKPHAHALLPDANGGISQVLVTVRDAGDIYALAHLPLALPPGDYTLATHHDPLDEYAAALGWGLGSYQFSRYRKSAPTPATLVIAEIGRAHV